MPRIAYHLLLALEVGGHTVYIQPDLVAVAVIDDKADGGKVPTAATQSEAQCI